MQLRSFPVIDRPLSGSPELTVVVAPEASRVRTVLEVVRPHRWLLPMVALGCGTAIAGGDAWAPSTLPAFALALGLVGPLVTTTGHVINAYFDRDLQKFNPLAPVRRPSSDALVAAMGVLCLLSLMVAHQLGGFAFNLTCATLAVYFALNAPPLRLRRQTWWNSLFFGLISVGGPWMLGEALVAPLSQNSVVLASIFAFGALGLQLIDTLHKGVGERRAGLQTLAALLGPEVGAGIAALVIDTAVTGAAIMCFGSQAMPSAAALVGIQAVLLVVQGLGFRQVVARRRVLTVLSFTLYMIAMAIAAASLGHPVLDL